MPKKIHRRLWPVMLCLVYGITACTPEKEDSLILHENWAFRQSGTQAWHPATVPGVVHLDLLENGLIEDPFYRDNEKDQQYIEQENWEYQTYFSVPEEMLQKQQIELHFAGLDTYAEVQLNGELILQAQNMFREWTLPVKGLLKADSNLLQVKFNSPIKAVMPIYNALPWQYPAGNDQAKKKVSIFSRKAPYHYGWDWGPRFVTSGIWREVSLFAWDQFRFEDFQVYQEEVSPEKARLKVKIELFSLVDAKVEAGVSLNQEVVKAFPFDLQKGLNTKWVEFEIEEPRLWWTNGLGEAYLYDIGAVAAIGKLEKRVQERIGLRSLELVQEEDEYGKSFYFKLNGQPVFMKGANYIPQDNFLTRVDEERYRKLITSARDANMNMLRVWGGGIYENDVFYELCDEMGILVWQDFMFACSMYPGDEGFLENVRQEAIDNVKRLRNHASLALWCGNNEIATAWHNWGWQNRYTEEQNERIWADYQKLFHELLPEVVAELDPNRPYWPSSPNFEEGMRGKDHLSGDMHYWDVWHGQKPFEEFEQNVGRFMSEYGFQSFPEYKTVASYTLPEDQDIESGIMLHHQRHPIGNQLIRTYMERDYPVPENFEDFLYVSQLLQARGIGMAIRAHRIRMPRCMGSLYWQLNDCWPVASWSGIDYYGRWKALHYTVKKEYQPVMLDIVRMEDYFDVYIVNDHPENKKIYLKITLHDFEQAIPDTVLINERLTIDGNASEMYHTCDPGAIFAETDISRSVIHLEVIERETEEVLANRIFYFLPPKDLNLPETKLDYEITKDRKQYQVKLKARNLAKNVFLSFPEADGHFSDNYFDILPGQEKTVIFTPEDEGVSLDKSMLKVKTLKDVR